MRYVTVAHVRYRYSEDMGIDAYLLMSGLVCSTTMGGRVVTGSNPARHVAVASDSESWAHLGAEDSIRKRTLCIH